MNKFFVTGDLHGDAIGEMKFLNSSNWKEQRKLTKQDYLIQVGDFGFIWNNVQTKKEKYWLDWINDRNYTFLFIDGNHDNFPLIWSYPEVEMFGGVVHQIHDSIFYLKRGNIYTIGEKTFWIMGGADSIDKNRRVEGKSWWKEEIPNFMEMKIGMDNLDTVGWKVDYAITHDAPEYIRQYLMSHHFEDTSNSLVRYLNEVFFKLEFTHHYFGHHHMNKTLDNHTCLYKVVKEIT